MQIVESKKSKQKHYHSKDRRPFFKTIIVGADFSKHSKRVFEDALSLAKKWKLNVALVHVTSLGVYGVYDYYTVTTPKVDKDVLEAEVKEYYQIPKRQKNVQVFIEYGYPADELVRIAKKFKNPLIMVGHSEKGVFSRMALGSVTRKLAAKSPVPIWIQ